MKKKGISRNKKLKKKNVWSNLSPFLSVKLATVGPIYRRMTGPSKLKTWSGVFEAHAGKSW